MSFGLKKSPPKSHENFPCSALQLFWESGVDQNSVFLPKAPEVPRSLPTLPQPGNWWCLRKEARLPRPFPALPLSCPYSGEFHHGIPPTPNRCMDGAVPGISSEPRNNPSSTPSNIWVGMSSPQENPMGFFTWGRGAAEGGETSCPSFGILLPLSPTQTRPITLSQEIFHVLTGQGTGGRSAPDPEQTTAQPAPPQISGSKRSRPHEHNSRTNSCLWGARVELTGTTPLQCARP